MLGENGWLLTKQRDRVRNIGRFAGNPQQLLTGRCCASGQRKHLGDGVGARGWVGHTLKQRKTLIHSAELSGWSATLYGEQFGGRFRAWARRLETSRDPPIITALRTDYCGVDPQCVGATTRHRWRTGLVDPCGGVADAANCQESNNS